MMYSQGLDMSPDDIMDTRLGRSSEGRTGSSGSKRKQGGQTAETMEIIRNAMEYVKEQLKAIVECLNLQRQDKSTFCAEVVIQLQGNPQLSIRDRVRLMRIIMRNVDDMKAFLKVPNKLKLDYSTIIFEDNA